MNPKPEYVRARTWEEMSSAEREIYTPRRRNPFMCTGLEYNPLQKFDDELPSFHRNKDD